MSSIPPTQLLPWLFPKLLGSVYCLAFSSLMVQVPGLYGSRGLLPIRHYLATLKQGLGRRAYRVCPTLFWLNCSARLAINALRLKYRIFQDLPPVPLTFPP